MLKEIYKGNSTISGLPFPLAGSVVESRKNVLNEGQQSIPSGIHKLAFLFFVCPKSGSGKSFRRACKGRFRWSSGTEGPGGKAGIDSSRQQIQKMNAGTNQFSAKGVREGIKRVFGCAVCSHVRNGKDPCNG